MIRSQGEEARSGEASEANDRVSLNGHRARSHTENGYLTEVITGGVARYIERAPTRARLAIEHEVHMLAIFPLLQDDRPRRKDELIQCAQQRT
jgi:hypothetical protein